MLNLQPLGQHSNRRALQISQPFDRQQSLILLRLKPSLAGIPLAKIQVSADGITEISQSFKVQGVGAATRHIQIRLYRIPMYLGIKVAPASPPASYDPK